MKRLIQYNGKVGPVVKNAHGKWAFPATTDIPDRRALSDGAARNYLRSGLYNDLGPVEDDVVPEPVFVEDETLTIEETE